MEERILYDILEHLQSAVYIVDGKGRLVYVNQAGERLDGFKREEVLGKEIKTIYRNTVLVDGYESPCLAALTKGGVLEDENIEWFSNRKVVNALTSAYPIEKNGKRTGAFAICDDVSVLKKRIIEKCTIGEKRSYPLKSRNLKNGTNYVFEDIIGESSALQNAVRIAKKYAAKNIPIMIYGETGTGKELFAQSIHNASDFYAGPFMAINCAAIPDTLLESTLFGTVRGAYTGAVDHAGMFELAGGGTLFLDEINSMNIVLQAKLLRVLQEKQFQRIGDSRVRSVKCRIISATNVEPTLLLREKIMREDLYFRLSAGIIHIPPLRVRGNDLDLLIQLYIDKYNEETNSMIIGLLPSLKSLLHAYGWPGNVRELSNVIESTANMVSANTAYLSLDDLPDYLRNSMEESVKSSLGYDFAESRGSHIPPSYGENLPDDRLNFKELTENYEIQILRKGLGKAKGNLTQCAQMLGLSRQCLTAKLKKYQIEPREFRPEKEKIPSN